MAKDILPTFRMHILGSSCIWRFHTFFMVCFCNYDLQTFNLPALSNRKKGPWFRSSIFYCFFSKTMRIVVKWTIWNALLYIFIMLFLLFSRQVMSYSFATPWTVACQPPLSMGFPRQQYWRGFPFPSHIFIIQIFYTHTHIYLIF